MIYIIWSIILYAYTSLQYNFIEQLGLILTIFDWMLVLKKGVNKIENNDENWNKIL